MLVPCQDDNGAILDVSIKLHSLQSWTSIIMLTDKSSSDMGDLPALTNIFRNMSTCLHVSELVTAASLMNHSAQLNN